MSTTLITTSLFSTPSSPLTLTHHPSVGIFRPTNLHLRYTTVKSSSNNNNSNSYSANRRNEEEYKKRYLDEDGAVEDMDGYMNYLSLEYDSVWDTKPSWCQPWTITLTGALIITGSWLVLHNVFATSAASALIGAWWYIFLYSYPKAYTEMIAERRKKVNSGTEDTFGFRNSP